MTDSDDEVPRLSGAALAALEEFYAERREREEQINKTLTNVNNQAPDIVFDEDWVNRMSSMSTSDKVSFAPIHVEIFLVYTANILNIKK